MIQTLVTNGVVRWEEDDLVDLDILKLDFDLDPAEEIAVVAAPWTEEQIATHRARAAKDCAG